MVFADILDVKLSFTVCCAVDIGLFASLVLSHSPNPTILFVIPDTVPVKVGASKFAFQSNAVC